MSTMPSTPVNFKLGLRRSSYSRVSYEKDYLENNRRSSYIYDIEPLKDGKQMQQNEALPVNEGVEYINFGLEDQMEVHGYVRDKLRSTISWVLIFVTLGALRLVFHWWPHWMLLATHRPSSLDIAHKVLVIERYQQKHKCYYVKEVKIISAKNTRETLSKEESSSIIELDELDTLKLPVHFSDGIFQEFDSIRLFKCKKIIYVWDPDRHEFVKLKGLDHNVSVGTLHSMKGLTVMHQFIRRVVYGANEIVVPMRSVTALLCLEVLNPFYIFQIFSFGLWIADEYVYYAMCILAMSLCSIVMAVIQTRRNQVNLWSRVYSRDVARVLREGETEETIIPTEQLVPGDILVLPSHGCVMYCDAVLLTGTCIVNESMLTGESVPVTKTPIANSPNVLYQEKEHARHTLFSGTQVIQTRYYGHERVIAVVIRTSFATAKGSLVRSILYPPPVDFKFERDSYKFVQILAAIAACGVLYTIVSKALRGNPVRDITLEALDLITIVVPPALPAAMTVGRMYAQSRLERANIFCISPRSINVAGSINCICFDKTGTLTEDGLDMWGVVPVAKSKFEMPERNIDHLSSDHLLKAMATCHSLTMIDGSLAGDPLDLKMFESTGWVLEEPEVSDDNKYDLISPTTVKPLKTKSEDIGDTKDVEMDLMGVEVGIVRQFPFSSSLQRMSVITRCLGDRQFVVYSKGSPEKIASLCDAQTVPDNFDLELEEYTKEGYRVLGVAYKNLASKLTYAKMQRLSREDAESNLVFLGLVVLENRLKPQTTGVLAMLRDAKVRTIMVTGDNMLTALSVARDCGIIAVGQNVITVHAVNTPNSIPTLNFVQHIANKSPLQVGNDVSQMTYTESVTSFTAYETFNGVPTSNGTARNSVVVDLPFDATTFGETENPKWEYSFALTGQTWSVLREHYPDVMSKVATRGAVFARMSPDDKQQLVQELQNLGYFVAMVGDGANDCGALKAAHAGISLSEAESSVASPFTSKDPNISCIVEVIREGRAALVTSFSIFKYMAAYSLMQFASVIILYSLDSNLTDIEFLYIDLFVITTFAFVLGRVESAKGPLYPEPPQSSLISFIPILSLIGQMVLAVSCQVFSFHYVMNQPWYVSFNTTTASIMDHGQAGYENYAVFAVSSLQYIILALVFSRGAPYRQNMYTSPVMVVATLVITGFTIYLIVDPCSWLVAQFEMALPKDVPFRLTMVLVSGSNLILAVVFESICDWVYRVQVRRNKGGGALYYVIDKTMKEAYDWPPMTDTAEAREHGGVNCLKPPLQQQQATTFTIVNSPQHRPQINTNGGVSENELEDMKYSTPMKSSLSLLLGGPGSKQMSEDNLSKYVTPPSSPTHCTTTP